MQLDIVNSNNEKVGSVELRDEVFGGRINTALIWESVVRQNASERQGTHMTKTRGLVSGTGKKPWRQKGTGRAQVGEARNLRGARSARCSVRSPAATTTRCRRRWSAERCVRRWRHASRTAASWWSMR
jgi:ribosomal protein L4